jgi:transposase
MVDSVMEAQWNLREAGVDAEIEEAVADKGYHATDIIELAESLCVRTYIPERKMKEKRNWQDVPDEKRPAVLNNRRRVHGERSKRLQRLRSELAERSFAHVCGTRRSWLHGIEKVQKRYLIAAVARNLGLVMRKLFGIGTPRGLQAESGLFVFMQFVCFHIYSLLHRSQRVFDSSRADLELRPATAR